MLFESLIHLLKCYFSHFSNRFIFVADVTRVATYFEENSLTLSSHLKNKIESPQATFSCQEFVFNSFSPWGLIPMLCSVYSNRDTYSNDVFQDIGLRVVVETILKSYCSESLMKLFRNEAKFINRADGETRNICSWRLRYINWRENCGMEQLLLRIMIQSKAYSFGLETK